MGECCPACGQDLPAINGKPMRVDLDSNEIFIGGEAVQLTCTMAELAYALARTYPRVATKELIFSDMYSGASDSTMLNVSVQVCKLRRRLKNTPLRIGTVWGRGYRFELTKGADAPSVTFPRMRNSTGIRAYKGEGS